jgi:hypothetical protein
VTNLRQLASLLAAGARFTFGDDDDDHAAPPEPPPEVPAFAGAQQGAWAAIAARAAAAPHAGALPEFHLRAECYQVLELYYGVQTQWRHAGGGLAPVIRTGLDYSGVRASPAFRRIPHAQREQRFDDLCILEWAYLDEMAKQAALDREQLPED